MCAARSDRRERTYTIGELAKELGVTTRTIRFYEDKGLLRPRRRGQVRIFSRQDRSRLRLVLRATGLGFSLEETRELFDLWESGEDEHLVRFQRVLREKRERLQRQKRNLEVILQEIDLALADCERRLATVGTEPEGGGQS